MGRRGNKQLRRANNRGQHQRTRTRRGTRLISKFVKYKYYYKEDKQ